MRSMTVGLMGLGVLCGTLAGAAPLPAQIAPAPAPVPVTAGAVQLGGSFRLRLENWDWFTPGTPANSDYLFGAGLLRISIGMVRPTYDWQVELAAPALVGLPGDAVAPPPEGQLGFGASYRAANGERKVGLVPKQAFFRMRLGRDQTAPTLRLGRFDFNEGQETQPKDATLTWLKRERISQRLIGSFAFTHVGRSFDGLHFKAGSASTDFTLMAVRPTEGVFQLDALGELDIEMAYAALTRSLFPAPGPNGPQPSAEGRLFAIYYQDRRDAVKTDNRPAGVRSTDREAVRVATFGAHYLHTARLGPGNADLLLWGAYQVGDWGSQTHEAHAYAAELGYRLRLPASPWVRIGYLRGSGDAAADDGSHETFFQLLPTPRLYARFPFFNLMNSEDAYLELLASPDSKLMLRATAHRLRLTESSDLWYQGGGAFSDGVFGFVGRPSGGAAEFGRLLDLSIDYQVSPKVAITLYAARALGRDVIRSVYPQGANAAYGYLEFVRKF